MILLLYKTMVILQHVAGISSYLYLFFVLGCSSFLHLYIVGSLKHPLSEDMSILARRTHSFPSWLPATISCHICMFFSTPEKQISSYLMKIMLDMAKSFHAAVIGAVGIRYTYCCSCVSIRSCSLFHFSWCPHQYRRRKRPRILSGSLRIPLSSQNDPK